ncbi:hypothetical protein [Photorhabdus heterorhabditis]|uniref:hypothetical protein n=1 Tax=Photorhabdus heterorhabditis TaxID=880156 RepID=UPI00165F922C|nr:hypothetical protein [Photorhabdus heterorhabditis]
MPDGTSTLAQLLLTVRGTQGVTFGGLPLKVTPQQKSNIPLIGSGLINHPVNLILHFID